MQIYHIYAFESTVRQNRPHCDICSFSNELLSKKIINYTKKKPNKNTYTSVNEQFKIKSLMIFKNAKVQWANGISLNKSYVFHVM